MFTNKSVQLYKNDRTQFGQAIVINFVSNCVRLNIYRVFIVDGREDGYRIYRLIVIRSKGVFRLQNEENRSQFTGIINLNKNLRIELHQMHSIVQPND